jgi:uncharacterized protein (TIGR02466 family)
MENRIEIVNPYSNYIFKSHYDFNFDIVIPKCKELLESAPSEFGLVTNGGSSHQNAIQPHMLPELKEYFEWLQMMVIEVATRGMGYFSDFHDIVLTNSWVNVTHPGGKTLGHKHPNTFIVVSTYLNVPENGGFYEAKDPLEDLKSFYYRNDPDWYWKQVPVTSGDLLLFPGWLKHRTQENKSNEDRWVLTTSYDQVFKGDYYLNNYDNKTL